MLLKGRYSPVKAPASTLLARSGAVFQGKDDRQFRRFSTPERDTYSEFCIPRLTDHSENGRARCDTRWSILLYPYSEVDVRIVLSELIDISIHEERLKYTRHFMSHPHDHLDRFRFYSAIDVCTLLWSASVDSVVAVQIIASLYPEDATDFLNISQHEFECLARIFWAEYQAETLRFDENVETVPKLCKMVIEGLMRYVVGASNFDAMMPHHAEKLTEPRVSFHEPESPLDAPKSLGQNPRGLGRP